jgi:hypothetical protein
MGWAQEVWQAAQAYDQVWAEKTIEQWQHRLNKTPEERQLEETLASREMAREQAKADKDKAYLGKRLKDKSLAPETRAHLLKQWLEYVGLDKRKEAIAWWESYLTRP